MNWTSDAVLTRLIEAYTIIEAVTRNPKPRSSGSAHPEMSLDASDRYTGRHLDEIERLLKEERERRATVMAASISAALEAQRWPVDLVADQDRREVLVAYATCRARNGNWSDYVQRRNRRNPSKRAWVRQKTYERVNRAAQQIAEKLNNAGLLLNESERCQTGQISHTSDFVDAGEQRASPTHWIAPDAKPLGPRAMNRPDIYTIPKPRKRKRRKA